MADSGTAVAAMTGPLLLTLDEAARSLSLSKRSVEELVYRGELPSVHVLGRCRRIAAQDLADFVDRLRVESDRQPEPLTVVERRSDHGHRSIATG